jgi:hypothetical protein
MQQPLQETIEYEKGEYEDEWKRIC